MASGAGLKFAGTLARDLGDAGFIVISGLAPRHRSGSASRDHHKRHRRRARPAAHDKIYPPEHEDLLAALLEQGAAISEMPARPCAAGARDFPPPQTG